MAEILREVTPFRVLDLTEGTADHTGFRPLVVRGIFQAYDRLNANKRIYPKPLWEKILESEDVKTALHRKRMLGETDHPSDWKMSLSRSSHVVTDLRMDNDGNIIGQAEILKTPQGNVVRSILEAGCEIGISSRGQGETHKNNEGHEVVSDGFKLETFDFVADPSTANAYPKVIRETIEREAQELAKEVSVFGEPKGFRTSPQSKGDAMDSLREFHLIEQEAQGLLEESKADDQVTRLFLRKQVEEKLMKLSEMRTKQPELDPIISPLLAQLQKRHVDLAPHTKKTLKEETVGAGGPIGPAGDILPDESNVPDYSDGDIQFAVPPLGPEVAGQVSGPAESRFAAIERLFNVDWSPKNKHDTKGMFEFDTTKLDETDFETLSGGPGSGRSSNSGDTSDYGGDDQDSSGGTDCGCGCSCCRNCGSCSGHGRGESRLSRNANVIDRQIENFLREA